MTVPSTHTVIKMQVLGKDDASVRLYMVAPKAACVRSLKLELERFMLHTYELATPPESQRWSVDDDVVTESLVRRGGGRTVIALEGSAAEALTRSRSAWQLREQTRAANAMLTTVGLKDKSVAECSARLSSPALCTTAAYTDKQAAALALASSLCIREAAQTSEATGISEHSKCIVSFTLGPVRGGARDACEERGGSTADAAADGAARYLWEWRCDEGHMDGYEYLRAELALCGRALFQFDYDEDRSPAPSSTWVAPDAATAMAAMSAQLSAADAFALLECLVPPEMRPSKHGAKLPVRSDEGEAEAAETAASPLKEWMGKPDQPMLTYSGVQSSHTVKSSHTASPSSEAAKKAAKKAATEIFLAEEKAAKKAVRLEKYLAKEKQKAEQKAATEKQKAEEKAAKEKQVAEEKAAKEKQKAEALKAKANAKAKLEEAQRKKQEAKTLKRQAEAEWQPHKRIKKNK